MPLMHSGSQKAFTKNLKTEMAHGKPQKQALAIAYQTKRMAKKGRMALGGFVEQGEDMGRGGLEDKYSTGDLIRGEEQRGTVGDELHVSGGEDVGNMVMRDEDMDNPNSRSRMEDKYANGGRIGADRHKVLADHMSFVNRMLESGERDYSKGGEIMDESEAHSGLHDVDDPFEHNSQHFDNDLGSEDLHMNDNMSHEEKKRRRYQAMRDAMAM